MELKNVEGSGTHKRLQFQPSHKEGFFIIHSVDQDPPLARELVVHGIPSYAIDAAIRDGDQEFSGYIAQGSAGSFKLHQCHAEASTVSAPTGRSSSLSFDEFREVSPATEGVVFPPQEEVAD
jgi:hypothetical protein